MVLASSWPQQGESDGDKPALPAAFLGWFDLRKKWTWKYRDKICARYVNVDKSRVSVSQKLGPRFTKVIVFSTCPF